MELTCFVITLRPIYSALDSYFFLQHQGKEYASFDMWIATYSPPLKPIPSHFVSKKLQSLLRRNNIEHAKFRISAYFRFKHQLFFTICIAVATSPAIMPLRCSAVVSVSDSGLSTARSIFPAPSFAAGALSIRGNRHDPTVDPD